MPLYSHKYYREKAKNLTNQLGLEEPPVDPRRVADHLGIEILELTTPDWFSGVLLNIEGDYYIVLNSTLAPVKKSYTIAHEIGHHQLHKEELCYLQNEKKMHLQKEADIFAEELLMPARLVQKEARRWYNNPGFMARLFEVKEDLMRSRMLELGLVKSGATPFSEYERTSHKSLDR